MGRMGNGARWLVAVLAFVGIAAISPARSQDPEIQLQLGGIELALGMAQEDVLRKLAVLYDVRHMDNAPGNWTVLRKGGPPYRMVGAVSFRTGRLTFVNKHWGPGSDDQSASAMAMALHDAVQALTVNGARSCAASVEAVSATISQTVFQCGRRRLVVVAPSDRDTQAGVSETLQ